METIQITVRTSEEAETLKKLLKALDFVESVSSSPEDTSVQVDEAAIKIPRDVSKHAGSLKMPEGTNYKQVLAEELSKKYIIKSS